MANEAAIPDRMKWWVYTRFGMFIHWGLYSLVERGEWVMWQERIPKAEYAKLARKFKPERFDADAWVRAAKQAGMRYMVLTARHHDGFCLCDCALTNYTSTKIAARCDFVHQYVDACRRHDMPVGLYYSLLDWRFPAYFQGPQQDPAAWDQFIEYIHDQVRELCTDYGKLDILWYDGGWPHKPEDWRSKELNATVRQLQPQVILNNRSGLDEDLDTPEQNITASKRPWESCMTIDDLWWGYHPGESNLKSGMQLVRNLVRCVAANGNFLLNVGPKADGAIPPEYRTRRRKVGAWLKANGESIYGAGPAPLNEAHLGHLTARDHTLFVHVWYWPGTQMTVCGVRNKVLGARLLASGQKLRYRQDADRLVVRGLPDTAPDPIDTVVALELDGPPAWIPPEEATFWALSARGASDHSPAGRGRVRGLRRGDE